jgi:hypothetical protein
LQAEAEDCYRAPPAYLLPKMKINPLPAGFVVPVQPVSSKARSASTGFTKIKHDGESSWAGTVQSCEFTAGTPVTGLVQLAAITAAELIKAKSFTIDGEAAALGPDGLSRFGELPPRGAPEPIRMPSTDRA